MIIPAPASSDGSLLLTDYIRPFSLTGRVMVGRAQHSSQAVRTSAPETAASVVAASRHQPALGMRRNIRCTFPQTSAHWLGGGASNLDAGLKGLVSHRSTPFSGMMMSVAATPLTTPAHHKQSYFDAAMAAAPAGVIEPLVARRWVPTESFTPVPRPGGPTLGT
jgi:hypothetical protein